MISIQTLFFLPPRAFLIMMRYKGIYIFLIIILTWKLLLKSPSSSLPVHNNDELNSLLNNQILSDITIKHYPGVLKYDNPYTFLVANNLLYSTYLTYNYKTIDSMIDDDKVIVNIFNDPDVNNNNNNNIDKKNPKVFIQKITDGLYFQYIHKLDLSNDIPIIRMIDMFNNLPDSRLNWHFVPFGHYSLHFYKISFNSQQVKINYLKQFDHVEDIHFNSAKFKIFQISDLHFNDYSDITSVLKQVNQAIKQESPNLIVISGDLIDKHQASNYKSIVFKFLNLFIKHKLPYLFTFGDADYGSNIEEDISFLAYLSNFPYCLNYIPNNRLKSLTNYNLKIHNDGQLMAILSILDTNTNEINHHQVNWLYRFNNALPQDIFKMALFHFPLPNFRPENKFKIIGNYLDQSPIPTNTEKTVINDFINNNYNVISVGHQHRNDGCILHETNGQIWLCYSSSMQSEDPTFRVFEVSNNKLLSWKLSQSKGGFDYQMIKEFKDKEEIESSNNEQQGQFDELDQEQEVEEESSHDSNEGLDYLFF